MFKSFPHKNKRNLLTDIQSLLENRFYMAGILTT